MNRFYKQVYSKFMEEKIKENPFEILEQRIETLQASVDNILYILNKEQSETSEKYLSSDECRKMFYPAISKSTLYRWTLNGLIKKYRICGKVVFKNNEISDALKNVNRYKIPKVTDRVASLDNSYVKYVLKKKNGLETGKDIPTILVESEKNLLLLKREIKTQKQ